MQTAPTNWAALFAAAHKTEYKYIINNVAYYNDSIQGTPVIMKPLLDQPAIGRVCSATMTLTLRPVNVIIPKAARVCVYCRLVSPNGNTTTDWLPQGRFFIASRRLKSNLILNLRDDMVKAGQTYLDKSSFEEWPQQQADVAADIARIMGVDIDSRTILATGTNYLISSIGTDTLMSELLGEIGVANGGNWIMSEAGKLRLVPFASPKNMALADQVINKSYRSFEKTGTPVTVSRVTLTDSATGDIYTAGTDAGYELTCASTNGNQAEVNAIYSSVNGASYTPYELQNAMLDPRLELGDTLSVTQKDGTTEALILGGITVSCNVGYLCNAKLDAKDDAEDEYPYQTAAELQAKRAVHTNQIYYGARLSRDKGLVIEKTDGDVVKAKAVMNTDKFSFQVLDNGVMLDKLYFDPVTGQYVFDGKITVRNGSIEFIGGASFTSVRYSTDRTATIPHGWSVVWDAAWDDGETQVWAIYSYNGGASWTAPVLASAVGHDPITVSVYSTAGSVISQGVNATRVYAKVYQGSTDLTSTILYSRFVWHKYLKDGTEDMTWWPTYSYDGRRDSINVSQNDISEAATFVCELLE